MNGYTIKNGLLQPLEERSIINRCPLFMIRFLPNEHKTIYLRVHSRFTDSFGLVIQDTFSFVQKEQLITIGNLVYLGAALAFLIYNFFFMIYMRESIYLYYILDVGSFILFILLIHKL